MLKNEIEALGFVFKRSYFNKFDYELNNTWKIGGAFLTHNIKTNNIIINSVDEGFNMDGPNHSIKYNGICRNIDHLKQLMEDVGLKHIK